MGRWNLESVCCTLSLLSLFCVALSPAQKGAETTEVDTVVIHPGWPPWVFTMTAGFNRAPEEIKHYISGVRHSERVDSGVYSSEDYRFDDINRDGYTDILVGDRQSIYISYQACLFDPADSMFKYDSAFDVGDLDDNHILGDTADNTFESSWSDANGLEGSDTYRVVNHHPLLVHSVLIDKDAPNEKDSWYYSTDTLGDGSTGLEIDTEWTEPRYPHSEDDAGVDSSLPFEISKFKTFDAHAPQAIAESRLFHDGSREEARLSTYLFESEQRRYSHDRRGNFYTYTIKKPKHGKMVTVHTGKVYLKQK